MTNLTSHLANFLFYRQYKLQREWGEYKKDILHQIACEKTFRKQTHNNWWLQVDSNMKRKNVVRYI